MALTVGIVAGEASGDLLGSRLIRALKKHRPDIEFVGIAGPKMMSEGAKSLYPMDRLSLHKTNSQFIHNAQAAWRFFHC
jgi:lipid-A-disaccharide synthase